ncbi:hypothetical protein GJ744_011792 [Endocarpon pusillum]|uniref:Pyruvate carboxyltransferase domain-containing protein n=1 Tax=Endocarpon pusillum TaxID=364733 RepID=A0A8H7ACP5_9EURO|nr:hypothetical protein GJ744_011792 [Endocarpon pusillum]
MPTVNDLISHHTSHTMENGASSSNHGLHDNVEGSDFNGHEEGGFLEASLRNVVGNVFNIAVDGTSHEPDEFSDDAITQASSPYFLADSFLRKSDYSDTGTSTKATSMCSSGNLVNFSIIDSTLREGEQFATAYFDTAQKLKTAQALEEFGVEYIEVTSPAASDQSKADCEAICKLGLKAKILCHIRCNMEDARIAVQQASMESICALALLTTLWNIPTERTWPILLQKSRR